VTEAAGILALAGFSWLALFQFLLALGFPLGAMAWGERIVSCPAPSGSQARSARSLLASAL
jgi:hypothetical protein